MFGKSQGVLANDLEACTLRRETHRGLVSLPEVRLIPEARAEVIVRNDQECAASWAKDTGALPKRREWIVGMLDHVIRNDGVKRLTAERKSVNVGHQACRSDLLKRLRLFNGSIKPDIGARTPANAPRHDPVARS